MKAIDKVLEDKLKTNNDYFYSTKEDIIKHGCPYEVHLYRLNLEEPEYCLGDYDKKLCTKCWNREVDEEGNEIEIDENISNTTKLILTDLEKSPIKGIELDCDVQRLEEVIQNNEPLIYIADSNVYMRECINYKNLSSLIKWLQDINEYCIKINNRAEYVDWITAREYMDKGNKAKLNDCTYWVNDGELYFDLYSEPKTTNLSLPMIDSKEWILL